MAPEQAVRSIVLALRLDAADEDMVRSMVEQVEDPRIARVEALCDATESGAYGIPLWVVKTGTVRDILRGEA